MLFSIVACSGDDGIEGGGFTSVDGTAAVGAAISQRPVTAKSLNGIKVNTTTALDGKYSLGIEGSGSVLLKVDMEFGGELYSIADKTGTTNIHPYTDLIVRNWFKTQGLDIDAEFASDNAFSQLPTSAEILAIQTTIENLVSNTLLQFDLPAGIDIISYDFDTNGYGFDGFLDYSQVVIGNDITIVITDPNTSLETEIVTAVGLETDLSLLDSERPSIPTNLRAIAVGVDEVSVVWEAASDNIGVAAYNIYRNGSLIPDATTPYPAFSDRGLLFNTQYCYQVEAMDGAGNVSISKTPVMQNCPVTDGNIDTTPPPMPTLLTATAQSDGSITLSWTQANIGKVNGFHIYRGPNGNVDVINNVGSVSSTSFTDYVLDSATEYCYQVTAYGVTSVESTPSTQACATTP